MSFTARMSAWGPFPCRLGPLPRAPGAPPRGGSPAQTTRPTFPHTTYSACPKSMSILITIFDRFGLDLGSLLGVIFGHVGAFFGPSWSRNRLRTVLSSKMCFFTKPLKINGFKRFFTQDGAPKRPKIAPRRVRDRLGSFLLPLDFSLRFWIVFGSFLDAVWAPK